MDGESRVGGKRKYVASAMRNRQSMDEIAELEADLRRAYWKKELRAQVETGEAVKNLESAKARAETEGNLLRAFIESEEENRVKIRERAKAREEAARELAERMAREAEKRAMRTEEGLKEAEVLLEVERRLEECMNSRTLERKLELGRERAEERRILSELMEIRLASQKAEEEKLERDRETYLQEIERRANVERSRRTELEERRERVLTSLLATILQEDANEREKKRLLEELVFEELELDRMFSAWKERNVKRRMAKALLGSLEEQIKLTELCKASFIRRDQEFADETSRRLAEDEKILRLTSDARKRALLRYRQDLERMIVERRRIRDEEMFRIELEAEEESKLERLRAESIKEIRESLLREHAPNVGEFFNKYLLTEEEQKILSLLSKNEIEVEEAGSSRIRGMSDSQEESSNDDADIAGDLNALHLPK